MEKLVLTGTVRPREYEAIYVLRPDVDAETAAKVSTRLTEVLARDSAVLTKVESWGRRKLAYPVRKYTKGIYMFFKFVGKGNVVAEFERNLRMQKDAVLKFQTVRVRDEVELESVKVDPEEIKFVPIEPIGDDEHEESIERALGLLDDGHSHDRRGRRMEAEADDMGMDDGDDDDMAGDVGQEEKLP